MYIDTTAPPAGMAVHFALGPPMLVHPLLRPGAVLGPGGALTRRGAIVITQRVQCLEWSWVCSQGREAL